MNNILTRSHGNPLVDLLIDVIALVVVIVLYSHANGLGAQIWFVGIVLAAICVLLDIARCWFRWQIRRIERRS
jgi:Kef-type K+ transport system membrane component KefB